MVDEATVMPAANLPVVTAAFHLRDQDRTDRRGVRCRRTRDAAEDHRRADVDQPEPAPEPADKELAEIDQPGRDAGLVHQEAHEDEERQSDQRVGVETRKHPLRQDLDEIGMVEGEEEQGRETDRVGDRDAQDEQNHEAEQQDRPSQSSCIQGTPSSSSPLNPSQSLMKQKIDRCAGTDGDGDLGGPTGHLEDRDHPRSGDGDPPQRVPEDDDVDQRQQNQTDDIDDLPWCRRPNRSVNQEMAM